MPSIKVESVGSAAQSGRTGKAIEEAMERAVLQCIQEGVTDPQEVLARKLTARERAKREAR